MACHMVAYMLLVKLCGVRIGDRHLIAPTCHMWREFCWCVPSISFTFSFFPMDNYADCVTPQLDGLLCWASLMDTLYSHSLLLPEVLLHSVVVKLWLSCLVEIKVRDVVSLVFWRSPLSRISCSWIPTLG
jgi:hypothetical protein